MNSGLKIVLHVHFCFFICMIKCNEFNPDVFLVFILIISYWNLEFSDVQSTYYDVTSYDSVVAATFFLGGHKKKKMRYGTIHLWDPLEMEVVGLKVCYVFVDSIVSKQ